MNSRLLLTTGAIIALCAGSFFAGRDSSAPPAGPSSTMSESAIPQRPDRSGRDAGTARSHGRKAQGIAAGSRMETAVDAMQGILATPDPMMKSQAWEKFVNTLDAQQFESVADALSSKSLRESGCMAKYMAEYRLLLDAWAKIDPLAALDSIDPGSVDSSARDTVLAAWTGRDPEAAIAWARQSHPSDMVGVIQSLASSDMARATRLLKDMPETNSRDRALSAILPRILAQGTDAAKAWISEITDQGLRARAVRDIAEDLAREDPAGTAAWLANDPGEVANRSMANVMAIWGSQDPEAASQFIGSLSSDHLRTLGLGGLVNQLASSDPRAAANLLDAHAADANDGIYGNFALQSYEFDPALAASYIPRIKDPVNQFGTYTQFLDRWLGEDLTEASTWVGENPLPEHVSRYFDHRIREIELRKSIEEAVTNPGD